jgi:hypothetical protein
MCQSESRANMVKMRNFYEMEMRKKPGISGFRGGRQIKLLRDGGAV